MTNLLQRLRNAGERDLVAAAAQDHPACTLAFHNAINAAVRNEATSAQEACVNELERRIAQTARDAMSGMLATCEYRATCDPDNAEFWRRLAGSIRKAQSIR